MVQNRRYYSRYEAEVLSIQYLRYFYFIGNSLDGGSWRDGLEKRDSVRCLLFINVKYDRIGKRNS